MAFNLTQQTPLRTPVIPRPILNALQQSALTCEGQIPETFHQRYSREVL